MISSSPAEASTRAAARPGVVVLMRSFHPIAGGAEKQALRLAEEMRRRDVPVQILTQRHPGLAAFEVHHGIPIHRVRTFRAGHRAALGFLASAFVWLARHRRSFAVIHANRSTSGLIAGVAGAAIGRPVVCKLTGGHEIADKQLGATLFGRMKLRLLERTVGRFVAVSAAIEASLRAIGIAPAKIARIPNGIDPHDGRGPESRAALGFDAATPIATFVGRMIRDKGIPELLEAWARVRVTHPSARLLLVGDGRDRARFRDEVDAAGLAGSVSLLGRRDDVGRILAASDVFVFPSLREGMSNALLEAMSAGLAVVAADDATGGNRELVRDGENGLLVPPGDAGALARALDRLLGDAALRRRLGERARTEITAAYSIERVADRYLAVYEELLGHPGGVRRAVEAG